MPRLLRLPKRFDPRAREWLRFWRGLYLRTCVTAPEFSIVSCNCWGSQIYQDMKRPYLTPFVGLYLDAENFLRFIENYDDARRAPLEFISPPPSFDYPLGRILGDIEIHFIHYLSETEAREKWSRRCARLPVRAEDCHYMMCDRDGCTDAHIARFFALPHPRKIFFGARPHPAFPQIVVVPPREPGPVVEEGVALYDQCGPYFRLAPWLNSGLVQKTSA